MFRSMTERQRSARQGTSSLADEAAQNIAAMTAVVAALAHAVTPEEAVRCALDVVREQFGWAYGSEWRVDAEAGVLRFAQESGQVNDEFRNVTVSATFAPGVGLSGRVWRTKDLVFVADLGEVKDCVRAPAAQRAGVRSGVCFPLILAGEVVATMDFFATETLDLSRQRMEALRAIGLLVSQAYERANAAAQQVDAYRDMAAVNEMLRTVSQAASREEALSRALDSIRTGFGWVYGSFWRVDPDKGALVFTQESGDAGAEFREVTLRASFREGVGLSGRAWRQRDLVFVPDLAEVTDCVRAPAAQRAGVKSGVCFPIIVAGEVVGTMDFFVTTRVALSGGRESALRNTAFLLGQVLERFAADDRLQNAGRELVTSIEEVERNVLAATSVATEGQRLAGDANAAVSALGVSSAEIEKVVKVIQGIAAQTNLLALNATIEAARAGESGRGFAVVANEVKDLANETATATSEVDAKVRAIQEQVETVIRSLHKIGSAVERINETQNVIGGVLTEQVAVTKAILQ